MKIFEKNGFVDHFIKITAKSGEILSAKNVSVIKYHLKKRIKLFPVYSDYFPF